MASNKLDPKHESQKIVMKTVDSVFYRSIEEREKLIGEDAKLHKEKIMTLDLNISMCIKKRAKLTKGGFNYIPECMWSWRPYYPIDNKLLPKIAKARF